MVTDTQSASTDAPKAFHVGEWTFHANVFRLERGQEFIKLEPRVAQLLSCLVANAGSPVSRESLMEEVWPGMVVGDEALTNAINKLRKAFGDDRQNPRMIETIPKAGYRLIAKVEPISSPESASDEISKSANESTVKRHWLQHAQPVVAIIALLLTIYALLQPFKPVDTKPAVLSGQTTLSTKPSIAVLPFDNLSQDPEQEYFTDGVTDDIITHLAKNSGLIVIARDSSFFYKGKNLDIETIAEKLNVGHILRGSVRRTGEQLVINAQLVDVATSAHVWAEQYTQVTEDLFKIENEISSQVIGALLNKQLNGTEHVPSAPTQDSRAHDYLLLGRYKFYKFASKADNRHAQNMFREAIALDPEYALAYALLGWTYDFEAMNGWADDRLAALKQAEQLADKAIELQPELPLSYYVRGLSFREQGFPIKALGEVETALKYDPNNANARVLLATLLYYAGRPQVGLERIQEAIAINPHHPFNYEFHLGQAYFILHQYEQAIDAFKHGIDSNPAEERLHVWLAAAYAQSGDIENASWEAEQVMTLNSEFSVARMEQSFPFQDPVDLNHFTDGLRLAGLN